MEKVAMDKRFPKTLNLRFEKVCDIYMGVNFHQDAALYRDPSSKEVGICDAKKLQGRDISSNIVLDAVSAIEMLKDFNSPTVVFIKHGNPVGVASADSLSKAFVDAFECDTTSLFGTTIGLNGMVDKEFADFIMNKTSSIHIETIVAPSFGKDSPKTLSVKKEMVLFELQGLKKTSDREMDYKKIVGGLFVQDMDLMRVAEADLKVMTKRAPSKEEVRSLLFADKIAAHAKSNAIVLCRDTKTVGIGAGQALREEAFKIAMGKAKDRAVGATLASDARLSRTDIIEGVHGAGITAIIQPGNDKIDQKLIELCNSYDISMVFTNCRHFSY